MGTPGLWRTYAEFDRGPFPLSARPAETERTTASRSKAIVLAEAVKMPSGVAARKRRRSQSNASDSAASTGNADTQGQASAAGFLAPAVQAQVSVSDVESKQPDAPGAVEGLKRRRKSSTASDKPLPAASVSNSPPSSQREQQGNKRAATEAQRAQIKSKSASSTAFSALVPLKPNAEPHTPLLVSSTKLRETLKPELAAVAASNAVIPSVWDATDDISPETSPAKPVQASAGGPKPSDIPAAADAAEAQRRATAAESALDGQRKRQQALFQRQSNAREALADFVAGTVSCHIFQSNFPEPEWHPALPAGVRLCDSGPGRTALAEGMRAAKLAANSSLVGLRRRDLVEDLASGRLLQSGIPALDQRLPTPHLGGFPLTINSAPWATGPVARRHIRKAGIGIRAPEKGIGPRWWGIKPLADAPPDTPLELKMGVAGKFLKPMPSFQRAHSASIAPPAANAYSAPAHNGQAGASQQPTAATAHYAAHAALPQGFNSAHTGFTNQAPPYHPSAAPYRAPASATAAGGAGGSMNPGPVYATASAQPPAQRGYAPPAQAPGGGGYPQRGGGIVPAQTAHPDSTRPSYGQVSGYVGSAAVRDTAAHDHSWRQRAVQAASIASASQRPAAAQAGRGAAAGQSAKEYGTGRMAPYSDSSRRSSYEQPRYDRYGSSDADRRGGGYRGGYRGDESGSYGRSTDSYRSQGYKGDSHRRSSYRGNDYGSRRDDARGSGGAFDARGSGGAFDARGSGGAYYGSAAPRSPRREHDAREQDAKRSRDDRSYTVPARHSHSGVAAPQAPGAGQLSAPAQPAAQQPEQGDTHSQQRAQSHSRGGSSTRLRVGRGPKGSATGPRRY